jgi:two-component system response regulator YesN
MRISVSYLSRLIKKVTEENTKDYVIRLKIEKSKEHLAAGIPVAVTNEMIGYANISYFIKTFRQIVGVTPSAYQKSCCTAADAMNPESRKNQE